MRIQPIAPENLSADIRYVHDEIAKLVGRSQGQVKMIDENGALLGPFIPLLQYPQFGVQALSFIRTLDHHATLDKAVREVAILTVGGYYSAKFELYAYEIMAEAFGIPQDAIATLASGGHPQRLNAQQTLAHDIAYALVTGKIIPNATYQWAVEQFGKEGTAELIFLVAAYSLIAVVLNGFDIPAPDPQS